MKQTIRVFTTFSLQRMNQIELIRKRSKNNNVILTARIYQTANQPGLHVFVVRRSFASLSHSLALAREIKLIYTDLH